jgi:hypothetical protein
MQVREMPLRTFWSYNRQVDRLRAEEDIRQLNLLASHQDPEGCKQLGERLMREIANPVHVEQKFDSSQFDNLKKQFSQPRAVA